MCLERDRPAIAIPYASSDIQRERRETGGEIDRGRERHGERERARKREANRIDREGEVN